MKLSEERLRALIARVRDNFAARCATVEEDAAMAEEILELREVSEENRILHEESYELRNLMTGRRDSMKVLVKGGAHD